MPLLYYEGRRVDAEALVDLAVDLLPAMLLGRTLEAPIPKQSGLVRRTKSEYIYIYIYIYIYYVERSFVAEAPFRDRCFQNDTELRYIVCYVILHHITCLGIGASKTRLSYAISYVMFYYIIS